MTDEQFENLALGIKAAYPSFNVLPDKHALKVWFRALGDLDYKSASVAILEHMNTSTYPPSIADIRGKCAKQNVFLSDWGEAWANVKKAIRNFGSYQEIEALERLDEVTRETVKRIGFKSLCMIDISDEAIHRAQFRDIYNAIVNRRMERAHLSPEVLAFREQTSRQHIESQPVSSPVIGDYTQERKILEERRADPERITEIIKRSGLRG